MTRHTAAEQQPHLLLAADKWGESARGPKPSANPSRTYHLEDFQGSRNDLERALQLCRLIGRVEALSCIG